MAVVGIVVGIFLLFSAVGGVFMYFFAVVRDHSGKRQENLWEKQISPHPGYSEENKKKIIAGAEYIKSHITELVKIKSHDGLTLVAHVVEPENFTPRGVFIMAHGYRSHAVHDFSCAVKAVNDLGFACLLIDQRAHGYSEGEKIGFGALEKYDISRWAAFAEEHFGLPIVLDGVSMGSSTVMMGAEVGYPSSVSAIIADCGYSNAGAICRKTMKQWFKLPPFPVYYVAKLMTKLFAKYDLDKTDAAAGLIEIKKRRIPILFAHGDADDFVPYSMSVQNYAIFEGAKAENGEDLAEFFTASGAKHGISFLKDHDGYMKAIYRLLDRAGLDYAR